MALVENAKNKNIEFFPNFKVKAIKKRSYFRKQLRSKTTFSNKKDYSSYFFFFRLFLYSSKHSLATSALFLATTLAALLSMVMASIT